MDPADYIEKIRRLEADLREEDRLRERLQRLFPGQPFTLIKQGAGARLRIVGLSPPQLDQLMTP